MLLLTEVLVALAKVETRAPGFFSDVAATSTNKCLQRLRGTQRQGLLGWASSGMICCAATEGSE
jgi:hypothetical protein